MKPTAKNLLLLFSLCLLAWSCKKDFQELQPNVSPQTKITAAFTDLKVNSNFDWKNERSVIIHVTPLEMGDAIMNSLKVKLPGSNKAIYATKIAMNSPFSTTLKIPAAVNEVNITYGSISKMVAIQNGIINFDFLTE